MKSLVLLLILLSLIPATFAQWQKQVSGTSEDLNDVAVLKQTTAVVVGNNGTILKTTDAGLSWVKKYSITANNLNAVSFRNEQNGIAVGNGVICRTSDGGEHWLDTAFTDNFITVSYREPYFRGPNIIIGSEQGTILFSNNDGNTWNDTLFFFSWPWIAVGFNYYSPNLHSPIAYAAMTHYTALSFFPSNYWNLFENPIYPVWDILTGGEFYDLSQYLIGWGGNPGPIPFLLRRIDSDTTWEYIYPLVPPPYVPEDITSINETLFVCGSDGKIFKSTDRGDKWNEQASGTNEDLNAVSFLNNIIGYSVGKNGTILFTSNGGVSSVEELQIPLGYNLFQNYPNPFNPSTKISWQSSVGSRQTLKVYDVLGNEVAILVDEYKPAGNYEVEFQSTVGSRQLASGVYFYRLQVYPANSGTGNYVQAKKMILAK